MDGSFAFWWVNFSIIAVLIMIQLFCYFRRSKRMFTTITSTRFNDTLTEVNKAMPSPPRLPIIGHLYLFQGNPVIAMTKLSKKYGEIYSLRLGSVETVVVTSLKLIREILIGKGSDFGDRPNFLRYNVLFGNDKENSLAFCDWSQVQRTRRALARRFCHTELFVDRINAALERASDLLLSTIRYDIKELTAPHLKIKLNVQKACSNVFFDFFCSEVYDDWKNDTEYESVVRMFDEIFWEINQGHCTDVLPILAPLFKQHLNNLANMGTVIRQFVLDRIVNSRLTVLDKDNPENFLDILLTHLEDAEPENRLTLEQVLYELEDFLGGHSAVSNLLCRALVEIGSVPGMSDKIYNEYYLENRKGYLRAVVYETLRKTSSPIVPHVASTDSALAGYKIKKGTVVFINNYDLNTNTEYWTDPHLFMPQRFLRENGTFIKPAHFFPFSYGKRACMGYQLVEKVTERLILDIIKNFNLEAMSNPTVLPIASVAISPHDDIRVRFIPRAI